MLDNKYAMQLQSLILTLLCFIVQLLAMVWYSLSFIVSIQLLLPHINCFGILPPDPHPEALQRDVGDGAQAPA